ncbi:MAG: hypothetical protein MR488_01515 [Lachnospiraceae bacterium]|jgi:hypothetical protein|nr:hypothetical protein [Lachnospiraceae bacterium]
MGEEGKQKSEKIADSTTKQARSGPPPACFYHSDCFAYQKGKCRVLYSNDFDSGQCPFYRSRSDNRKELEACMRRLLRIGRRDLLDKYMRYHAEAGAFANDYSDGVADEILAYRNRGAGEEDWPESGA